MKKIWLTTLAVGALAVPVGVASAQSGDDVVDDTTTTQECDGDQLCEHQRMRDGSGDMTQECDGDQLREQQRMRDGSGVMTQLQRRAHQGEAVGEMVREREQVRTEDCDGCAGDRLREHRDDQDHTRDQDHSRDQDRDGTGGQTRRGGHDS